VAVPEPLVPTFGSVPEMLAELCPAYAERELFVCGNDRLTYAEAEGRSATLADGLVALGVSKGDRVGVLLPSGVEFVLTWLATTRIGAVFVPFNTFLRPPELVFQLRDADVRTLIIRDRFLKHTYTAGLAAEIPELARGTGTSLRIPAVPLLRTIVVDANAEPAPAWAVDLGDVAAGDPEVTPTRVAMEASVRHADDAVIVYTSGSSADPKGVVHTQAVVVRHPANVNVRRGLRTDDRIYLALPLFWVGGFSQGLIGSFVAGACAIVDETFDAGHALEVIERERVTIVSGWPFHATALEAHPDYGTRDLSSLRTDMRNLITPPAARVDLSAWPSWIGMTETFGAHLLAPMDERLSPEQLGSFGTTLPGLEHRIVDPYTRTIVAPGEVGELQVRGYAVMRGYVGRERESVFTPDGWFPTGDLGRFSADGHFFLTGRLSDTIKTSGSNVSPAEVAAVLARANGVRTAHVVGIPDPEKGEIVAAAVVASGPALDTDELLATARRELSAFKVPRHVVVVEEDAIPMTATGKVRRGELRDLVAELVANA
jgi:acyl-CoA synthetase (AMP-forming)/AMP-acid ligase II